MSGMNLEIWFPQQSEVTVFLESDVVDPLEEQAVEIILFSNYACRQIANLSGEHVLCSTLAGIDVDGSLAHVEELLGDVSVASPRARGGAKGFTAQLRPGPRFKLKGHGFGLLGKGVGYYAPTSTLALLCWLLRRRDDDGFRRALAVTAVTIGNCGRQGMITVTSQTGVAFRAASAGMDAFTSLEADAEPIDVSDAAAEAIAAHNIDFPELLAAAGTQLAALVGEVRTELGSQFVLPTDYCIHLCRMFVFAVAVPETHADHLEVTKAMQALDAARQTGNDDLVAAAESHHQELLKSTVAAQGLEPLMPELHRRLFTYDADKAA